jgi:hypothetical protein
MNTFDTSGDLDFVLSMNIANTGNFTDTLKLHADLIRTIQSVSALAGNVVSG